MTKKIAFFKFASFSLVNKHLLEHLRREFAGTVWDEIDAEQIYQRRSPANLIYSLFFYFWDILRAKRSIRGMIIHSPYYFRQLKKQVGQKLNLSDYDFTFQTQSLWDLSTPDRPHFVFTDHTELAYKRYALLERPIYPQGWLDCEKKVYENADLIFTTSDFCAQSVIEDYDIAPEKVICVHSGINLKDGLDNPSDKQYDSKNILFVGVQWKRKGGPQLVKAFAKVRNLHPDATLTIVGIERDDVEPEFRDVDGVTFTGFIKSDQLRQYFLDAQVFCLPSIIDPSAVALVEAYNYFLPVVSTFVGGTPSRVIEGKTGLLTEPNDVDGLVERLDQLLSNSDKCREFGANGNKLMKENFTWEQVSRKIKNHIDLFLEKKHDQTA